MIPLPPRLAAFAARVSLSGIAIAILAALLAVQTIRLEGFKVWPVSLAGWKPRAIAAETALDAAKAAYARQSAKQDTIAADYDRSAANARQQATVREETIRTIYRDVPVNPDCEPPAVVRSVLAEAVASANASTAGQPVNLLP